MAITIRDKPYQRNKRLESIFKQCGKVTYETFPEAAAASRLVSKSTGQSFCAYRCALCRYYHIGHGRVKKRKPEA